MPLSVVFVFVFALVFVWDDRQRERDDSTHMLPTDLGGDIDHLDVLDLSRRNLTHARLRFLLALRAGICLGLLLGERSARET